MTALPAHTLDALARAVLGAPDAAVSTATKLRFGRYSLDLTKGRLYDFEEESSVTIETVVAREKGLSDEDAIAWVNSHIPVENGYTNGANGHHEESADLPDELADERALIGLILLKPDVLKFAEEEVAASDFLSDIHRAMFVLYLDARDSEFKADISTVVASLVGDGHKGPHGLTVAQYVARLARSAPFQGDEVADDMARRLARQIRQFAEVERGKEPEPESTAPEPFRSKFGGRRWEEIGRGAQPYPWTVENIIPEGESIVIYGQSGSGKSFDSFDMGMAIARNLKFNGSNVESGLVIYVAAEAGKGFEKRKLAYCTQHGLRLGDPLPFYLLTKRADLFGGDTDTEALIAEIHGIIALHPGFKLRAIFLDTVSALTPGMNENASQDVSKVRQRIDRIKDAFQVSTIIVHHTPKGGSGGPRGHGSFTADFETTICFETVENFYDDHDRPVHRATVVKQREGRRGLTWEFVLEVVEVGKNKWGNPETSCVVVPRLQERQQAGPARITDQQRRFMEAVHAALDGHGIPPAQAGLQLPRSILKVVDYRHVKTIFARGELNDGDDPRDHTVRLRQALSRSRKDLFTRQIIGADDPYIWPTGRPVQGFVTGVTLANVTAAPDWPEGGQDPDQSDIEQLLGTGS